MGPTTSSILLQSTEWNVIMKEYLYQPESINDRLKERQ